MTRARHAARHRHSRARARAPKSCPSRSTSGPARREPGRSESMYPSRFEIHERPRVDPAAGRRSHRRHHRLRAAAARRHRVRRAARGGPRRSSRARSSARSNPSRPCRSCSRRSRAKCVAVNADLGDASGVGQREAARRLDDPPAAERARRGERAARRAGLHRDREVTGSHVADTFQSRHLGPRDADLADMLDDRRRAVARRARRRDRARRTSG